MKSKIFSGTRYVTNQRITLEILEEICDFEDVFRSYRRLRLVR
jgi:hypothetical protein